MRRSCLLVMCLLLSGPAGARAEDILLDRVEFVRAAGAPQVATTEFPACDPEGSFTLVVEDGPHGTRRVSSGTIRLNGLPVVTQEDFNQQVARITKPLPNVRENNRLEVLLSSAPGSVISVTIKAEMNCLDVSIDSPLSGGTVSGNAIAVFGRARHRTPEIGVTVNGVLAQVNGEEWVANAVPVSVGANTLTATVTDAAGKQAQTAATVTCLAASTGSLRLVTDVESGIAPLNVSFFLIDDTGRELVSYALDFEGDGIVDLETGSFEGVQHTYTAEGIFPAELVASDAAGNRFATVAAVNVHPLPPLKTTWNAMKGALEQRDLSRVVENFAGASADTYGKIFASLEPLLPQIAAEMQEIELIYLRGDRAKFRLRSEELRDGVPEEFVYYVYFVRDADGFWKIRDF